MFTKDQAFVLAVMAGAIVRDVRRGRSIAHQVVLDAIKEREDRDKSLEGRIEDLDFAVSKFLNFEYGDP